MNRSNSNKKTYIDVSHIMSWQGRLTGIERVEYHLIEHYLKNQATEFIAWDKESSAFISVTSDFIKTEIIEKPDRMASELSSSSNSMIKVISRRLSKISSKNNVARKPPFVIEDGRIIILAGLWDNQAYIDVVVGLTQKNNAVIHIVYDMIPLVMPNFVVDYLPGVFGNYMYKILPVCDQVMCISEATAKDVKKLLVANKLNVPTITTFRLGDDLIMTKKPSKPTYVDGEFALSVGTVEARKNHWLIYYAYKKLLSENQVPPKIYIVGKRGWLTDNFQYVVENDTELNQTILFLNKTNDNDLEWLYRNCCYTIFPSFYEGWGLPVAESLAYGRVTLASSAGSIPAVGAGLVDYFSPYSSDELAELIKKYSVQTVLNQRINEINKKYAPVSWEASAKEFSNKTT